MEGEVSVEDMVEDIVEDMVLEDIAEEVVEDIYGGGRHDISSRGNCCRDGSHEKINLRFDRGREGKKNVV